MAEVAEGATEEVKHAADITPAAAEEADGKSGKEGWRRRLSKKDVKCILEMKPRVVVDPDEEYARMTNHPGKIYSQEFIDKTIDIFRNLAESNERIFTEFQKHHAWMRAEVEEKGYVELDDNYIAWSSSSASRGGARIWELDIRNFKWSGITAPFLLRNRNHMALYVYHQYARTYSTHAHGQPAGHLAPHLAPPGRIWQSHVQAFVSFCGFVASASTAANVDLRRRKGQQMVVVREDEKEAEEVHDLWRTTRQSKQCAAHEGDRTPVLARAVRLPTRPGGVNARTRTWP
ncbi:hypothetical protein C2845_PM12G16000 [Panicum miliaceum]|uniref:Uncharacterized protein n=1 Tax=Panicum miliaceum TaxID=4540 RepID=A0A3L6QIR5_PANMI|nr:hypothetical protein C2845_PM12G16000 [Panicum miliaceum]